MAKSRIKNLSSKLVRVLKQSGLVWVFALGLFLSGCEIFTIGGDYKEPEKQLVLDRLTPDGATLLYWAELRRKNYRAATRMHYVDEHSKILTDNPAATVPEKRFSLMSELVILAKQAEFADQRKVDLLDENDDESALTRIITVRNDTLDLGLIKVNNWWYIETIEYKPYRI